MSGPAEADPGWDERIAFLANDLNQRILNDPEYLFTRPGHGAPITVKGVCIHRLIGADEQHDGDIIRPEFLPEWRVPIAPGRRSWLAAHGTPTPKINTGSYLPVNAYAVMHLSPAAIVPPRWVHVDVASHQYTVALVRYVRRL